MQEEWAARAAAEEESKREAAKREAAEAEARAAEGELMRAARQSEEAFMNRYRAKWHMDDPTTRKMEAETSHVSEVDSDHAHAEAAHFYADATSRPALRLPPLMPKSKSAPQLANVWVSKPVRSKRGGVMLPATEVSVRLAARHSNKCVRRSTWFSCIRPCFVSYDFLRHDSRAYSQRPHGARATTRPTGSPVRRI